MSKKELYHLIAAVLVLTIVASFGFALKGEWVMVLSGFVFSILVIGAAVLGKKAVARILDADIEHEIWFFERFGLKPAQRLKKPVPLGIVLPLVVSIVSLGIGKLTAVLTYEAKTTKYRAAKKFGYYSFTEITETENAFIGAGGIAAVLVLGVVAYLVPYAGFESLAKLAVYYAFWNLLPFSKLDGTQIFFGSRILWSVLAIITAVFTAVALLIVTY